MNNKVISHENQSPKERYVFFFSKLSNCISRIRELGKKIDPINLQISSNVANGLLPRTDKAATQLVEQINQLNDAIANIVEILNKLTAATNISKIEVSELDLPNFKLSSVLEPHHTNASARLIYDIRKFIEENKFRYIELAYFDAHVRDANICYVAGVEKHNNRNDDKEVILLPFNGDYNRPDYGWIGQAKPGITSHQVLSEIEDPKCRKETAMLLHFLYLRKGFRAQAPSELRGTAVNNIIDLKQLEILEKNIHTWERLTELIAE